MLELNGIAVEDTFAEAFPMSATRLVITADDAEWAEIAAAETCGFASSVIACDCEAGREGSVSDSETPDGRPGVSVLVFGFSRDAVAKAAVARVGQCVLTCPTTACYDGLPEAAADRRISIGGALRYFGDGFQFSKKLGRRRFWRIPVMDGEFVCEDRFGTAKGVGGGNLLICGRTAKAALDAARLAADEIRALPNVILPFPGGVVRAGSKVGSRYKTLKASTNDKYCPTLRPLTESRLPEGAAAVYELVIDGLSYEDVRHAMKLGVAAACSSPGIALVTAGNYGGKLGEHHFPLGDLVAELQ